MKKLFWIWVLVFNASILLNSCETESETDDVVVSKSYWKLKSTEFWGIKPISGSKLEQFGTFPFNQTYSLSNHANVTYSGQEGNITRTEVDPLSNVTITLTNTWSALPDKIFPDTVYKITYESKGNANNGIGVSIPVYYNAGYQWHPLSFRNGPVTANLLMSRPDTDPSHQKMKICVNMSSGSFYYMEWTYIYEWIP
jgi:hypothetical protein